MPTRVIPRADVFVGPRKLLYFRLLHQKQIPLPLCGIEMTGPERFFSRLVEDSENVSPYGMGWATELALGMSW